MNATTQWTLGIGLMIATTACGGGGGSSESPNAAIAGSWYGTYEATNGALTTIAVTVDNNLSITSLAIGGQLQPVTGTIAPVPGRSRIYAVPLSNGVDAGFFLDPDGRHVVFADEDWNYGVMQKGAASGGLPTFAPANLFGASYSGTGISMDGDFEVEEVFAASVTIANDGSFHGSSNLGWTFQQASGGELTLENAVYGRWVGGFQTSTMNSGPLSVIMSADRAFIGCWAIDASGSFPADVEFYVWRRQ